MERGHSLITFYNRLGYVFKYSLSADILLIVCFNFILILSIVMLRLYIALAESNLDFGIGVALSNFLWILFLIVIPYR